MRKGGVAGISAALLAGALVGGVAELGAAVGARAGGVYHAQPASAAFSGSPTQTMRQTCGTSHQDHSTLTATVTSTTGTGTALRVGDTIVIHSVTTIDDSTGGEGFTTGTTQVFRTINGKVTPIGKATLSATNSSEGLLDGYMSGTLQAPGSPSSMLMANFWVQFNSTGSSFTGALGDGSSYSRANQASDSTDNHAIIGTGTC